MNQVNNKLISIIVPVYNTAPYLECCVNSLCSQTYCNMEILLIDDGSTDGSGVLCDRLEEQNANVRVFHKENGGLSSARNRGIEEANGDYLGFVDSDDYVHKDMYRKLLQLIEENQSEIAVCRFKYFENEEYTINGKIDGDIICVANNKEALNNLYSENNMINSGIMCDKLFSKELFETLIFPEKKYHEDEYIIHYLFDRAQRIVYSSYYFYYYRRRTGSITNSFKIHNLDIIDAYHDRLLFFKAKGYADLEEKALSKYVHILAYCYFSMLRFYPFHIEKRIRIKQLLRGILNKEDEWISSEDRRYYKVFLFCPLLFKALQKINIISNKY